MSDDPLAKADLWRRAASFAQRKHQGQLRKDGATPYAAHPCRVALTVAALFGCDDPATLAIALLHDVLEDCDADFDELAEEFGEEVARCVAALSKDKRLPYAQRERAYDEALAQAPWRARLVKLADVLDNLSDVPPGHSDEKPARMALRAVQAARPLAETQPVLAKAIHVVEEALGQRTGAGGKAAE